MEISLWLAVLLSQPCPVPLGLQDGEGLRVVAGRSGGHHFSYAGSPASQARVPVRLWGPSDRGKLRFTEGSLQASSLLRLL